MKALKKLEKGMGHVGLVDAPLPIIKDNEVLVIEGDFADARVLQRIVDKRYDIIFHQQFMWETEFT